VTDGSVRARGLESMQQLDVALAEHPQRGLV
jgi:hypothetical protein